MIDEKSLIDWLNREVAASQERKQTALMASDRDIAEYHDGKVEMGNAAIAKITELRQGTLGQSSV